MPVAGGVIGVVAPEHFFFLYFFPCETKLYAGSVWIIGDSIVRRAVTNLGCKQHVRWFGRGGAGYNDVPALLAEVAARGRQPDLLVVHIGTNNLANTDLFCMRQRVAVFMQYCIETFPRSKLIWSDILPRACYFGAKQPAKMEMKRRVVNKWARSFSKRIGASVLHHPQFRWSEFALFRYDGVHLSPSGNSLFQTNLRNCICSCQ